MSEIDTPDTINRRQWSDAATVAAFTLEGFSDEGERQLFLQYAGELRGANVLDLGFGGGRTTTLLRLLTDDYVGLDYTPEMVQAARVRHPGVDLRVGDARDLSMFADGSFGAAVFSFNALDALDHADRALCLAEIARVLRPGGVLIASTFNLDGPDRRAVPWSVRPLPWLVGSLAPAASPVRWRRAAKGVIRLAVNAPARTRSAANWRRLRPLEVIGDGWALAPVSAHDFGLLVHFVSQPRLRTELAAVGLDVLTVRAAEDGRELTAYDATTEVRYFQFAARVRRG